MGLRHRDVCTLELVGRARRYENTRGTNVPAPTVWVGFSENLSCEVGVWRLN